MSKSDLFVSIFGFGKIPKKVNGDELKREIDGFCVGIQSLNIPSESPLPFKIISTRVVEGLANLGGAIVILQIA